MNLKFLTYFVAALEEGNITTAAKRCHISQPSISSAITALEEDLNITLFTRHKKGVTPTADGFQLYNLARKLLNDAADIKSTFDQESTKQIITLGLMTAIDMRRVLALLSPILEKKEAFELHITDENSVCDARITCKSCVKDDENFRPLWKQSFVVALPVGHPLSLKSAIALEDLSDLQLIAREYCSLQMLAEAATQGIALNIVATAWSEEWAVALVNAGIGAAIVPNSYIQPHHQIVTRPFANIDIVREVGLVHAANKPLLKAFELILNN